MNNLIKTGCFILFLSCGYSNACDMCNYYLSINPNINKHQIGLQFRSSSYLGQHSHSSHSTSHSHETNANNPHNVSQTIEYFGTFSLLGRWYILPQLQLSTLIPFSFNYEKENNTIVEENSGVGDVIFTAMYQLLNTTDSLSQFFRQRMQLGIGIKLPTGEYTIKSSNGLIDPLRQTGTGSMDFTLNAGYIALLERFGINLDAIYRINTINRIEYQFANRLNLSVSGFYQIPLKQTRAITSVGLYLEQAEMDYHTNTPVPNTGGEALFGQLSIDLYWNKFSVNFTSLIPVIERLNGFQGSNQTRIIAGINYAFN